MFDVPVDATYVWIGVSAVSIAVFGVAVELPSATPPDATDAARAIDAIAAGPPGSDATHELTAERIRLGSTRIGLDGTGGRTHATFAFGPVTPALADVRLEEILAGERPASVFESANAFAAAVERARDSSPAWRPAPGTLDGRRVEWRGVNATLVG